MDATVAALLGSVIGALAAVAGSVITNVVTVKNERRRQEALAKTAYVQELRERSGVAFGEFAKVVQVIEWIVWYGDNDPDAIDAERIKAYEDEVSGIYKDLLGAMAMTASLNVEVYEEMRPTLSELYDLEIRVGRAVRSVASDRAAAAEMLRQCAAEAITMRDRLPVQLHRIMVSVGAAAPQADG